MGFGIRKNDTVKVLTGRDKGKISKVLFVDRKKNFAIVEKVNMVKRHMKARSQSEPGGILERESKIQISNIRLICPRCNKATRVGAKFTTQGKKVRICRKCDEEI